MLQFADVQKLYSSFLAIDIPSLSIEDAGFVFCSLQCLLLSLRKRIQVNLSDRLGLMRKASSKRY